jgi:hypothetical protein
MKHRYIMGAFEHHFFLGKACLALPRLNCFRMPFTNFAMPVRAGIFVEPDSRESSKLRLGTAEDATPDGAQVFVGSGTINMPLLTELPANPFKMSKNTHSESIRGG